MSDFWRYWVSIWSGFGLGYAASPWVLHWSSDAKEALLVVMVFLIIIEWVYME